MLNIYLTSVFYVLCYVEFRFTRNKKGGKMKLHVTKIRAELKRIKKNDSWLAKKMNISRALMSYRLRSEKITHAQGIANALGLDGRDLII